MAKKQLGIFYIDAKKVYFYGSNIPSILQTDVPMDTMSYGDIINKDKFLQIIQALVTTNKIEPVPLLILFSPYATYEKDAVGKTPDEINTDIQQFLDLVPFERVLSRIYKIQDKTKVIAVNKDVYEAVKHAFEKFRFSTVAVVSLSLLQKIMSDLGASLNLEMIASKFDSIKQYSFIAVNEINNSTKANQEQSNTEKPNPFRLYSMVGVLVVLFGVLIYMIITSLQPAPRPIVKQPPVSTIVTTPIPTTILQGTAQNTSEGTSSGRIFAPITPKATP